MEAVRAFNNELSSLYEVRPPVSRAKMAHVTKCAIKAIKFYKHVVQSVEKFIQKCKPEYKVPGLYVIDSIVRQSRHQFGSEKDVFAPRFTKNIVSTFQNLFKCPQEERSRVVRVLNLWQKNAVFPMEIIQPLQDLAADPDNVELVLAAQRGVQQVVSQLQRSQHTTREAAGGVSEEAEPRVHGDGERRANADNLLATQSEMLNTVTMLLSQTQEGIRKNLEDEDVRGATSRSAQQQQLQQLQLLQQQLMQQTELMQKPEQAAPLIDNNLLAQIQTLTNQLLGKSTDSPASKPPEPGFNKKLLDFDYGESDEEEDRGGMGGPADLPEGSGGGPPQSSIPGNVQTILNDPAIMQHIQQMSATLQKSAVDMSDQHRQHLLQQQEEFDKEINQDQNEGYGPLAGELPPNMPPPHQYPPPEFDQIPPQHIPMPDSHHPHPGMMGGMGYGGMHEERGPYGMMQGHDMNMEQMQEMAQMDIDERDQDYRHHQARERSRSPRKRRRSRSRSRDRDRDKRRRSRSRDRHRRSRGMMEVCDEWARGSQYCWSQPPSLEDSSRLELSPYDRKSRDRERERQREKERERKKKGLPPIKDHHLSVCSTTLWLGHLAKTTSEEELQNEIANYGQMESINMIPPRGCAFVCMKRRKDADRALERLKGVKINGNSVKVAWAPGIGVKGREFKDYWDVELGVSYIPWTRLPSDLDKLTEGGIIDEDALPEHLKGRTFGRLDQGDEESQEAPDSETGTTAAESGRGMTSLLGTPPPFVTMSGRSGMMPVMQAVIPSVMMPLGAQLAQSISNLNPRGPHINMPPTTSIPLPAGLPPSSLHPQVQVSLASVAANLAQMPIPSSAIGETMERELGHDMSQDSESPVMNSPTLRGHRPAMASPSASAHPGQGLSSVSHLMAAGAPPVLSRPGFPPRPPGAGFPSFDPRVPPPTFRMPLPGSGLVRPPFASSPRPSMQSMELGAGEDKDMRMEWPGQGGAGGRSLSMEDDGPNMGMGGPPGPGGGMGNPHGMMGIRGGFPPRGPMGANFPRPSMGPGLGGPPVSQQQQSSMQQQPPNPMLSHTGMQPMAMRSVGAQSRDMPMSAAGPMGIHGLGGVGPRINLPGMGGERQRGPAVNLLNLVSESQRLASQGGSLANSVALQGALRDALQGALQTAAANMANAADGRGPPNLGPRFQGQVPVNIGNRPGILGLRPQGIIGFPRFPPATAGFQRPMGPQGMFPRPGMEPAQPQEGPANPEQARFTQGRLLPTNAEVEKWRAERQNQEGPPGITPPFGNRNPEFDGDRERGRDQDIGRVDADREKDWREGRRDDRDDDSFAFGRRERNWERDRDQDRDYDRGRDRDRDRRDRDRERDRGDRDRDRNRDRDRDDRDRGDSDRGRDDHPRGRAPDQADISGLPRRERAGRQSRWSEVVPVEAVPAEAATADLGSTEPVESRAGEVNPEPRNPAPSEVPAVPPTDSANLATNVLTEAAANPLGEPEAITAHGGDTDHSSVETKAVSISNALPSGAGAGEVEMRSSTNSAAVEEPPSGAHMRASFSNATPAPAPAPVVVNLVPPEVTPEVTNANIPSEQSFPVESENHVPAPLQQVENCSRDDLVPVKLSGVSVSAAEAGSVAMEVSGEGSMLMDGLSSLPPPHDNGAHREPEAPAGNISAADVSVVSKLTEVARPPVVLEAVDSSAAVESNGPSMGEGDGNSVPVEVPVNLGEDSAAAEAEVES